MILAGGMSTRLYPLTRCVPKPLVPVSGQPIAAHILRYLASYGFDQIAINVHYLADMIEHELGDGSKFGVELRYLHEHELTGSAGAVKSMESFLDEPFVVVGCDDLTDFDLGTLAAYREEKKAIASIGLVEADEVDQYGVVILDGDGKIVDFQEKPARGTERSHLVNTGIYAFDPAIFERIPANTFYDFGKQVFPGLQQDGAAFYGQIDRRAYWADVGTPGEYRRATRDVLAGKVQVRERVAPDVTLGDGVQMGDDVRVGSGARIGSRVRLNGPTVIGRNVRVGDDATLDASIVWDGATIGAGAKLRDAIVGIDYTVDAGAELNGSVVAPEAVERA